MEVSVCCESATVPMNWGSFLAGISPAGRAVASIGLVVVVLALLTTRLEAQDVGPATGVNADAKAGGPGLSKAANSQRGLVAETRDRDPW